MLVEDKSIKDSVSTASFKMISGFWKIYTTVGKHIDSGQMGDDYLNVSK